MRLGGLGYSDLDEPRVVTVVKVGDLNAGVCKDRRPGGRVVECAPRDPLL
jgi:hypothetical protein